MAESTASRRARVKLQLRDKKGRWIEMGGGVKWFSSAQNKMVSGTVIGAKGNTAVIKPTNEDGGTNTNADVSVNMGELEVIDRKASLDPATQNLIAEFKGGLTGKDKKQYEEREKAISEGKTQLKQAEESGDEEAKAAVPDFVEVDDEDDVAPTPAAETEVGSSSNTLGYLLYAPKGSKLMTKVSDLKVGDKVYPINTNTGKEKSLYNKPVASSNATVMKNPNVEGLATITKVKAGAYAEFTDPNGKKSYISANHHALKQTPQNDAAIISAMDKEASSIYAGKEAPKVWTQQLKGDAATSKKDSYGRLDINDFTKKGNLWVDDEGKEFVALSVESETHAKNEVLAGKLYEAAGISVSAPETVAKDGKTALLQPVKPMYPISGDLANNPDFIADVQEGFAVDAWLANWSVANKLDLFSQNEDGSVSRDNLKGSLLFRESGDPKGMQFSNAASEWNTMRKGINNASEIFGSMDDATLQRSVDKLRAIDDATIDKIVADSGFPSQEGEFIAFTLKKRKKNILSFAEDLEVPPGGGNQTAKPEPITPADPATLNPSDFHAKPEPIDGVPVNQDGVIDLKSKSLESLEKPRKIKITGDFNLSGKETSKTFPDKGKTVTNANGNTFKVNDEVVSPKFGKGKIAIILPSTNSAKVMYEEAGLKVSKADTLAFADEALSPEASAPDVGNLKPGETGTNPANGKKFIVGKDGAALSFGDKVSYTKKGKTQTGTVSGIYAGTQSAKVSWDDGTSSTKKANTLSPATSSESEGDSVAPENSPESAPATDSSPDTQKSDSEPAQADSAPAESGSETNEAYPAGNGTPLVGLSYNQIRKLPKGTVISDPVNGITLVKDDDPYWTATMEDGSKQLVTNAGVSINKSLKDNATVHEPDDEDNASDEGAPSTTEDAPETQDTPDDSTTVDEDAGESDVASDLDENAVANMPLGTSVISPSGESWTKFFDDDWAPNGKFGQYMDDAEILDVLKTGGEATEPDGNVSSTDEVVNSEANTNDIPNLPVGSFVPVRNDSQTGFKKTGENQWEMQVSGSPVGFTADDNAVQAAWNVNKGPIQSANGDNDDSTVTQPTVEVSAPEQDEPLAKWEQELLQGYFNINATELDPKAEPIGAFVKSYTKYDGDELSWLKIDDDAWAIFQNGKWTGGIVDDGIMQNPSENEVYQYHAPNSEGSSKANDAYTSAKSEMQEEIQKITQDSLIDGMDEPAVSTFLIKDRPYSVQSEYPNGTTVKVQGSGYTETITKISDEVWEWKDLEGKTGTYNAQNMDDVFQSTNPNILDKWTVSVPTKAPTDPRPAKNVNPTQEFADTFLIPELFPKYMNTADFDGLPVGTLLESISPDISYRKRADGDWGVEFVDDNASGISFTYTSLELAASPDKFPKRAVPQLPGEPKTYHAADLITNDFTKLPNGTIIKHKGGDYSIKTGDNAWQYYYSPNNKSSSVSTDQSMANDTVFNKKAYVIEPKINNFGADSKPARPEKEKGLNGQKSSVLDSDNVGNLPIGTKITSPDEANWYYTKVDNDKWVYTGVSGTTYVNLPDNDKSLLTDLLVGNENIVLPDSAPGKYSKQHEEALQKFKTNAKEIGEHLRGTSATGAFPNAKEIVTGLDDIISHSSLDKDTTVYRGFAVDDVSVLKSFTVGSIVRDKSFASTSTKSSIAFSALEQSAGEHKVMLTFDLPKGFHAHQVDYDSVSDPNYKAQYGHESEVLLPRLFDFEVAEVEEVYDEYLEMNVKHVRLKGIVKDAMDGLNGGNVNQIDPTDPASKHPFKILDDPGADGDGFHASGPWGHFGASGVLVQAPDKDTGEMKYLIVENGELHEKQNQGLWQLPGGAVNGNENPYEGAAREMHEELDVHPDDLAKFAHVGDVVFSNGEGWNYTNIAAHSPSMFDVKIDVIETSDYKWVTAEELQSMADGGQLLPAFAKNVPNIMKVYEDNADKISADPVSYESTKLPSSDKLFIQDFAPTGGGQQGSNYGAFYKDAGTGEEYYIKSGMKEDHAKDEVLASLFYEAMGVKSAKQQLIDMGNGKLGVASKIIENNGIAGYETAMFSDTFRQKIQEDFAVDAFLANWDVAGLSYDNIIMGKNGEPIRIDPGASLRFRAQGAHKSNFGNEVLEWDFLRTGQHNESSAIGATAKLFNDMNESQLKLSAGKLLTLTDGKIDLIVDRVGYDSATSFMMKSTLKARRDDIFAKAGIKKEKELNSSDNTTEQGTQGFSEAGTGEGGSVPMDTGSGGNNGTAETADSTPAGQKVVLGKNNESISVGDNIVWANKGLSGSVVDVNPSLNKVQMLLPDGSKKWYAGSKMVKTAPTALPDYSNSGKATGEANPDSPLYGAPKPTFDMVPPSVSISNTPEGFVEHIEKRYADKVNPNWSKPKAQDSFYWSKVTHFQETGDKEDLEVLKEKLYIGDDMYEKAIQHLDENASKKAAIFSEYNAAQDKYVKELSDWKDANGISSTPAGNGTKPTPSAEDWTEANGYNADGSVDWSKAPKGTYSVESIINQISMDEDLAIHGISAMVDSNAIQDSNVRFQKVVDADGVEKIQAMFEVTASAKDKVLGNMSAWQSEYGVKVGNQGYDDATGIVKAMSGTNFFFNISGTTYKRNIGGAEVELQAANQGYGENGDTNSGAFESFVKMTFPIDASPAHLEKVLKEIGIDDAHPTSKEAIDFNKKKRIVSFFDGHVHDKNLKFEEDPAMLDYQAKTVLDNLGYELDDFKLVMTGNGFYNFRVPNALRDKMTKESGVKALVHSNMDYVPETHVTKYNFGLGSWKKSDGVKRILRKFTKGRKGYLATARRAMEGDNSQGMSPDSDIISGGGRYLFMTPTKDTKMFNKMTSGVHSGVVAHPSIAFQYLGNYANYGDNGSGWREQGNTIMNQVTKADEPYEVMVWNGLSVEDTWYAITNSAQKPTIIAELKARGITEINGIPVEQYFVVLGVDKIPEYVDQAPVF